MAYLPNYYGYQNPMYQQNRLNQVEQMYPQFNQPIIQQSSCVNGRIVDDVTTVGINEVSTDNNNPSIFLKRDLSEAYLKRYNQNGLIETYTYKLNVETPKESEDKDFSGVLKEFNSQIQKQLNSIDEKLQVLSRQTTNKGGGK